MTPSQLTLKLDQARWWLLSNQPFYGTLCMGLPDTIGNPHGKTACTDGRRIYWDADFLAKLTPEETRFVLIHETMHPAQGHLWRFPKPDQRTNAACDYAINLAISKIGNGVSMPKGGLLAKAYEGLAEEEIYNRLPANPPGGNGQDDVCGSYTDAAEGSGKPPNDQNNGKPGQTPSKTPPGGQNAPNGKESTVPAPSLREQWEQRVIQAAQAAKALGQGTMPADLQRIIDRTLKQRVDWRREMADFVKDAIATRNDWSRSSRRMAHQPVIYPRRHRDETGLVVFVRDTSGSIGEELLAEFNGLIESCMAESNCTGIVIDCDAAIAAEYRIGPGEQVPREAKGGGGTDFKEPFERARAIIDEGERIAGLVYLTDGMGSWGDAPDFASLWLCTTEVIAPFGRTVRIET